MKKHKNIQRLLLACLVSFGAPGTAGAANELVLLNQIVRPGETKTVAIQMNCDQEFAGFQFDICLPSGLSIPDLDAIQLVSERSNGQTVVGNYYADNVVRVVSYSMTLKPLKGNTGNLVTFPLTASADYDGSGVVTLQEIRFSTAGAKETKLANVSADVVTAPQLQLTMSLPDGWSWVSQNTENTKTVSDFLKPVETSVQRLMSATQELVRDPSYGLVGNLRTLNPQEGYRIQVSDVQNYAADEAKWCWPEDYEVTMAKGWNWLGYIPYKEMPVADALAGFTATDGDRIDSKDDGFAEFANGKWTGTLSTLKPGHGYHYKAGTSVAFCFPTSYPSALPATSRQQAPAVSTPWTTDAHRYVDNMTMIARLQVEGLADADDYVIAAFCGDECRGVAEPVFLEDRGESVFFLTVYGTSSAHESVRFMAYQASTGQQLAVQEQMAFAGEAYGRIAEPLVFHAVADVVTDIASLENPLSFTLTNGKLYLNGDQRQLASVRIVSTGGVVLLSADRYPQYGIDLNQLPSGTYSVVVSRTDGSRMVRKIIR